MVRAVWNGAVVAESDQTTIVEGNHYFPHDSVDWTHLSLTETHTICPWKGEASYYDVVVNGSKNANAAWFYPEPMAAAKQIKGYIAFWRGVRVSK